MLPDDTIGEPVTDNLDVGINPTDVTVPPPPLPPPVAEIVTFPLEPLRTILVPAIRFVTPVLVTVTTPVVEFAVYQDRLEDLYLLLESYTQELADWPDS